MGLPRREIVLLPLSQAGCNEGMMQERMHEERQEGVSTIYWVTPVPSDDVYAALRIDIPEEIANYSEFQAGLSSEFQRSFQNRSGQLRVPVLD